MAFTAGNDINVIQSSDIAIVGAGVGNDTYILSASTLAANQLVTIDDSSGMNTLQLVGGLTITSSSVTSNALQLTLSNGARITLLGADTYSFVTGGDSLTGAGGTTQNFSNFVTQSLRTTVPAAGAAPVTGPTVTVNAAGGTSAGNTGMTGTTGSTFTLTTNPPADTPSLTTGTDTINGTLVNSLATGDIIVDPSSTDSDVLNAVVTVNNAAPTLARVENVNVAANVLVTGLDLANVTGTKVLTLNSPNATSTGTVTNAAVNRAESVVAGANIGTLNVTSAATGTSGSLVINGGDATTIGVTGGAGTDSFNLTTKAGSTTTLATLAAGGDTVVLNLTGGTSSLADLGGLANNFTINSGGAANTLNGAGVDQIARAAVNATTNVTLTSTVNSLTTDTITKTGAGVLTVAVGAGAGDYKAIAADILNVTANVGGSLTANSNSAVLLSASQMAASSFQTLTSNGGASDTINFTIGASQDALVTGATVNNVNLTSNADTRVITTLNVSAPNAPGNTQSVAVLGTNQLAITTFTADANSSIVNIGSGKLIVGGSTAAVTVIGGSGVDEIVSSANADRLIGNGGSDILSGLAGNDTIIAGDGDDRVLSGEGADSATGGAGNDTFVIATAAETTNNFMLANTNSDNIEKITDFNGNGSAAGDTIQLGIAADAFAANITFVGTGNPAATVANINAATVATAANFTAVATALGNLTATTAVTAQVYDVTVSAGAVAGRYLIVNNADNAFTATDAIINITGVVGALNAQDFIFG